LARDWITASAKALLRRPERLQPTLAEVRYEFEAAQWNRNEEHTRVQRWADQGWEDRRDWTQQPRTRATPGHQQTDPQGTMIRDSTDVLFPQWWRPEGGQSWSSQNWGAWSWSRHRGWHWQAWNEAYTAEGRFGPHWHRGEDELRRRNVSQWGQDDDADPQENAR